MKRHLDFLVIGVQKSATTWLYNCLKEHPKLHLSAKKREVEYLGGDLYEDRGVDWYFSLLQGAKDDQKVGDVSVEYIFDPRCPEIIHQYVPNVKLIVSLRNPIDRAISAYYWQLRKGILPNLSLEDGLRMALEENCQNPQTRKYYDRLLARGFYDTQLQRYLQYVKIEQIMFILYEDIENQPQAVLHKIYKFLGVNPDYTPVSLKQEPKRNTYLPFLVALERMAPKLPILRHSMNLANQLLYQLGFGLEKPRLSRTLRQKLLALYQPHISQTEWIIQQGPKSQQPFSSLSLWMQNREE